MSSSKPVPSSARSTFDPKIAISVNLNLTCSLCLSVNEPQVIVLKPNNTKICVTCAEKIAGMLNDPNPEDMYFVD